MKSTSILFALVLLAQVATAQKDPQVLHASTEQGMFALSLQPSNGEPVIGEYHSWVVHLRDKNNIEVDNAEFLIDGGMAEHGHGLPTQPRVTRYLGDGKYLIEGLLFNMAGSWTLAITVRHNHVIDSTLFNMTINH